MLAVTIPHIDELREQGGLWQGELSRGSCKTQLLAEAEGTGHRGSAKPGHDAPDHSDLTEELRTPLKPSCDSAPDQDFHFLLRQRGKCGICLCLLMRGSEM